MIFFYAIYVRVKYLLAINIWQFHYELYQFGILDPNFFTFFFTLVAILEICKFDSENIECLIQHTQLPRIVISNHFPYTMPAPT